MSATLRGERYKQKYGQPSDTEEKRHMRPEQGSSFSLSLQASMGEGQREAVLLLGLYSLHRREIVPALLMFGLMWDLL